MEEMFHSVASPGVPINNSQSCFGAAGQCCSQQPCGWSQVPAEAGGGRRGRRGQEGCQPLVRDGHRADRCGTLLVPSWDRWQSHCWRTSPGLLEVTTAGSGQWPEGRGCLAKVWAQGLALGWEWNTVIPRDPAGCAGVLCPHFLHLHLFKMGSSTEKATKQLEKKKHTNSVTDWLVLITSQFLELNCQNEHQVGGLKAFKHFYLELANWTS